MFSPPSPWTIYRDALTPLKFGDALWKPSPIYSYKRVRLGDVGYIREGRFHLLFSAGIPLGSRVPGKDVPLAFEPLDIGPIISGEVRPPGYLRTDTVRQIGADVGGSVAVALAVEPGARIAFELTSKQGATLITKHPTYREHIERDRRFVNYIKQYYESWIDFAREQDYPEDVKPILVTGVDLTREFATVAYSDNRTRMECEFSAILPAVASTSVAVWGSWNTPGLVHTNCGPDLTQENPESSESSAPESKIPDEYTQCVFIRYYTIRKRFFIPTVLKAGAGPHQLPKGDHGDDDLGEEGLRVLSVDDSTEVDYPETGSPGDVFDEVIHNVPTDDRDSFDVVAEFIFQRSDVKSVLLHHDDIQDFPQGDEEKLTRLLAESGVVERVRVDGNGVGWLLSPTTTRSSTPQQPEGWESTISVLNAAVEALSVAKEDPSVVPAKTAFGIVGSILTMIRDTMIDQADYVELGLACADVCTALNRRLNGKKLDDLTDSVNEAINQLTRVAAEIHRNAIEQGKGDLISQNFRAKSNKENIATWRLNLDKIIQVLNPVPQPPTPTPLPIPGQLKSPPSDDDSDSGSDAGGTLWTISGGTNSTLGTRLTAPQSDPGKSLPRLVVNPGVPQHHQQQRAGPPALRPQKSSPQTQKPQICLGETRIFVTTDSGIFKVVDITGARDAAFIRERIFSDMQISDENQAHFSIYRTEVGSFAIGDALADEHLFELCRDNGDSYASLKFMVSHISAAVHKSPPVRSQHRSGSPPRSLSSASERIPQESGGGYDASVLDDNADAAERDPNRATIKPGSYKNTQRAVPPALRPQSPLNVVERGRTETAPLRIEKHHLPSLPPQLLSPGSLRLPFMEDSYKSPTRRTPQTTSSDAALERERALESSETKLELAVHQRRAQQQKAKEREKQWTREREREAHRRPQPKSREMGAIEHWTVVPSDIPHSDIPQTVPQPPPFMPPEYSPAPRPPKPPTKPSGSYNRTSVFNEDFRPPAEEMYERLGDFFPGHDLDEPVIEASSGGTSLTSTEAAQPFSTPDRRKPKKSIRVVANEHKRKLDRTSRITSANNVNMLRKRSTKLWGSKVEEVTAEQVKNASSALSTPAESPSEPKPIFKWVRGELIGKGTYGKVYVALNATTGEIIAVKQVEIPRTESGRNDSRQVTVAEALKLESEILKDLDHQNVVRYLGFEETPRYLSIFLEYVPGGSIASILRKHGRFDENVTKLFTSQILDGLDYLHSKGVIHRDLKPDNILVEEFGHCKITDFGISKRTDDINMIGTYTSVQGSVFWMAPEVINSKKKGYNSKIDIWSVGCVVLEMWTGERPWGGQEAVAVIQQLYQSKVGPPLPEDVTLSHQADDLRKRCFAINPDERPTAGELRQHSYLTLPLGWEFTGYS